MKTLVVYDSLYGNTEQIARAIGGAIKAEVKVAKVGETGPQDLVSYDLIIIGSPTQGGRHTKAMKEFLDKVPADAFKDKKVAAFDTRVKAKWVKIFGYAAPRIADALKDKGGELLAPGEAFFVKATKGPLVDGEVERAATWARALAAER
jgi:flavodoxin I